MKSEEAPPLPHSSSPVSPVLHPMKWENPASSSFFFFTSHLAIDQVHRRLLCRMCRRWKRRPKVGSAFSSFFDLPSETIPLSSSFSVRVKIDRRANARSVGKDRWGRYEAISFRFQIMSIYNQCWTRSTIVSKSTAEQIDCLTTTTRKQSNSNGKVLRKTFPLPNCYGFCYRMTFRCKFTTTFATKWKFRSKR